MELNKYDNIEQVLETIGEEVKGLSKDEFNDEENSYYENLYKKSIGGGLIWQM